MNKRKVAWVVAITALIVGIVGGVWALFGMHTVHLPESRIQSQVNASLPKETGKGVTVDKAVLILTNDQINVTVLMHGKRLGKEFELTVSSLGVPDYRDGKFYFKPANVVVEHFAFTGVTNKNVSASLSSLLIQRGAAKVEGWVKEVAEKGAVTALNRVPVYTLKDDFKGSVAKASLKSVQVQGKDVVVTFTLAKLTGSVLAAIVVIAVALMLLFGLIRYPDLFSPLEIVATAATVIGHN